MPKSSNTSPTVTSKARAETCTGLSVTNFETVGATSLLTTVEDLARWGDNFYHPRVGGAALVAQLQCGKLNSGKDLDYAFGLVHGMYRGLATVDHDGADAGYRADLLRFPQLHFSAACLATKPRPIPGSWPARLRTFVWPTGLKSRRLPC